MTPREHIAQLQEHWPVPPVTANDVPQRATALAANVGRTEEELLRHLNETDYAQYLLRLLKPRLPPELALLFDDGTLAVGTLGRATPDAYVQRVDDSGYAILFHTGIRDLIYRVTRILATHMYPAGEAPSEDPPGLADTARRIAEVFWWYQETGAAFGPDYPISDQQILCAAHLTQEAGGFLLAHEIGHVMDDQSAGAFDHLMPEDSGQISDIVGRQRGEFTADVIGAHLSLGVDGSSAPPDASKLPFAYAGIELALRIQQALEEVGFEFAQSHPPAGKRLAHLRSIIQSQCGPEVWRGLSSIAAAIDELMSSVVCILLDPTEHNAFFEQQAASIAREFHALLERCSLETIPDYSTFYDSALELFGRGYSHTMLAHIAQVSSRFFRDLQVAGSAPLLDDTLLQNVRKGKLVFGFIHDLKEPARSIFLQAFGSSARQGA